MNTTLEGFRATEAAEPTQPAAPQAERQEQERTALQSRYERLIAQVLRAGTWLSSPAAQLLSAADWELQFNVYRDQLTTLKRLGDELVAAKEATLTVRPRNSGAYYQCRAWTAGRVNSQTTALPCGCVYHAEERDAKGYAPCGHFANRWHTLSLPEAEAFARAEDWRRWGFVNAGGEPVIQCDDPGCARFVPAVAAAYGRDGEALCAECAATETERLIQPWSNPFETDDERLARMPEKAQAA